MQLKGTATWTAGSDNLQGSVTLEASSSGRSRMNLDLGSKRRTEFFSGDNDDPACTWAGDDNTTRKVATHNCFTPGPWFFPVLSFLPALQRGNISVIYVGREVENGISLEHIRVQRVFLGKSKISGLLNHLRTVDLYLDAGTMLPAAFKYFVHPDNDAEKDIPAEVRFSDYRDVGGIKIPFHLVRYLNGSPLLELSLDSVTLNTGVLAN